MNYKKPIVLFLNLLIIIFITLTPLVKTNNINITLIQIKKNIIIIIPIIISTLLTIIYLIIKKGESKLLTMLGLTLTNIFLLIFIILIITKSKGFIGYGSIISIILIIAQTIIINIDKEIV